jgi:L-threonylcarbamoyladenylate synthase
MTPPFQRHRLRLAARVLANGGVVSYPTEAVFGLGCDPWDRDAVGRVLAIKGRNVSKGLILIAADPIQLAPFLSPLAPDRRDEILASWPGPMTWVLPVRRDTPDWLTGRFDTLAVRVTAHPQAAGLCRAFGGAIVSTSANRAGRSPARTLLALHRALPAGADYVLCGACGGAGRPSTIRDGRTGRVLRA